MEKTIYLLINNKKKVIKKSKNTDDYIIEIVEKDIQKYISLGLKRDVYVEVTYDGNKILGAEKLTKEFGELYL